MPKRAKTWTLEQRRFMLWLATPDDEKDVLTQGALAREMGHADSTLSDWKRLPGFKDAVNALVREQFSDAYPKAVHALKRGAEKGEFQHLKLFFEMAGEYMPKQAVDVTGSIALTEVEVVRQVSKGGE